MNTFIIILNSVLFLIILAIAINWLIVKIQSKRIGGAMTNAQFEETMRKAQIIDIREKNDFKAKHILGARNIPYSTFKMMYSELRPDLPVYLYGENASMAVRAAKILKKKGFSNVHWLQNGFSKWDGKTKKSKIA